MARRWTKQEETEKRKELSQLYEKENKTIGEIAKILKLKESSVYDRLIRLGIPPARYKKTGYNHKRTDISIPKKSENLAEFIGVMLGDGSITPTQVTVTLGKKDKYTEYVERLIRRIFRIQTKTIYTKKGDAVIYFGSTEVVRWLLNMGLVFNKVKYQVDIPNWIFKKKRYMRKTLRGLIDTDGSVYKLKFGRQISFTNHSIPLLKSVRRICQELNFNPSKITSFKIYLTKQQDIDKYFKEIGFGNKKHIERFKIITYGRVA